jgi:predicted alpha/beta superfamily hydrolase
MQYRQCARVFARMVLFAALCISVARASGQSVVGIKPGDLLASGSYLIKLHSDFNDSDYDIRIFVPRRAAPPTGYPVLYVLDGNALFGTFADAIRNRSNAHEIEPAVVVGISGSDSARGGDRTYDYSIQDLSDYEKTIIKDLGGHPRFGGAGKFLETIRHVIMPRVESLVSVDHQRESIFGWSLGGLFVVQVMLTQPDSFSSYLVLSPSLWRSERAAIKDAEEFSGRLRDRKRRIALFLAAGSLEEQATHDSDAMTHAELATELRYCRLVGNTRELADILGPIFQRYRYGFSSRIFDGQTHNSVPWTAINPILNFALGEHL